MEQTYTIEELKEIVKQLRAPDGCPWDRAQTHESMETCLIEECYEVIEAIRTKDDENLCEELGDVLLQVLMHSEIASETQRFYFEDVVDGLAKKLVRRHPHVFGEETATSKEEGLSRWEAAKKKEKEGTKRGELHPLDQVPKALPALIRAQKVQKKAEQNFDASTSQEADLEKIEQLVFQLKDTNFGVNNEKVGELLFLCTDLARKANINAENSLTNEIETFINRFRD